MYVSYGTRLAASDHTVSGPHYDHVMQHVHKLNRQTEPSVATHLVLHDEEERPRIPCGCQLTPCTSEYINVVCVPTTDRLLLIMTVHATDQPRHITIIIIIMLT